MSTIAWYWCQPCGKGHPGNEWPCQRYREAPAPPVETVPTFEMPLPGIKFSPLYAPVEEPALIDHDFVPSPTGVDYCHHVIAELLNGAEICGQPRARHREKRAS